MLGIDIGNRSIKIIDAVVKKEHIEVKNFAVELLPDGVIENDRIISHEQLVKILHDMVVKYQFKGKANFVLCSSQVITRDIELAGISEADIQTNVEAQMDQILPGIVQTSVIDYKPKKNGEYMVCAAPLGMIKEFSDIIGEAGLKLEAIDIMSNAVSKLYGKYVNSSGSQAIIDIGHSKLDVTIINKGEMSLNKTYNTGNSKVDELIANYYNLSLEEADRVKRGGFKGYNVGREDLERYLRFSYEQVANDVKKLIQFFNSRSKGEDVSEVVLTGGGTLFKDTDRYLETILELPVNIFKPSVKIRVNPQLYLQNIIFFVPALGATVREG